MINQDKQLEGVTVTQRNEFRKPPIIPFPPPGGYRLDFEEPKKWSKQELFELLALAGEKDPIWRLYRALFLPDLQKWPFFSKNTYNDWRQEKGYKGFPAHLTHKRVLELLAGVSELPTWYATRRLVKGRCSYVVIDVEDELSDRFFIYHPKNRLIWYGCAEARAFHLMEALHGFPCVLIKTGGTGYHVYLFLAEPVAMYEVAPLGQLLKKELEPKGVEVFPRKGRHYIRLPFGPDSGLVTDTPVKWEGNPNPWPFISGPQNLHAFFDIYNNFPSSCFPTINQVIERLRSVWSVKEEARKDGRCTFLQSESAKLDAEIWENGADSCSNSNEAMMAGVRHCYRQGMDGPEIEQEVHDWMAQTGSQFGQVQNGLFAYKIHGVTENFLRKAYRPPVCGNRDFSVQLTVDDRGWLATMVDADLFDKAIKVIEYMRGFLSERGLPINATMSIGRKQWINLVGGSRKSSPNYYLNTIERLEKQGIIKRSGAGYSAGYYAKCYQLVFNPTISPPS